MLIELRRIEQRGRIRDTSWLMQMEDCLIWLNHKLLFTQAVVRFLVYKTHLTYEMTHEMTHDTQSNMSFDINLRSIGNTEINGVVRSI